MWWMLFAAVAISIAYWIMIRPFGYWLQLGVNYVKPTIFFSLIYGKKSFPEVLDEIYNMFPNTRYSGFFIFNKPAVLVQDPELIKDICVKNVHHFYNHTNLFPEKVDPFWAENLFEMKDSKWRETRSIMTSVLSNNGIKYLFPSFTQKSQHFVDYFLQKNQDIFTLEMKDTFLRVTNDIMAKTLFGLECDSLTDGKNKIHLLTRELTNKSGYWKLFQMFGYTIVPFLYKIFEIRFFPEEFGDFFSKLVRTNIEYRQKHQHESKDVINILLERRGSTTLKKIGITDEFIEKQIIAIMFPAMETISAAMSFLSYELAVNPEIQQKLIQEVDKTLEICNGTITYEALSHMKYINMVISETLRKWPVNPVTERICTKSYKIEPKQPNEKILYLDKNVRIFIPVYSFHRDPRYYPNPDQFDPERFSDKNKEKLVPYTYLTFGAGPRTCLGSRFAFLEIKILFFHILSHFQFIPVEKCKIPVTISKNELTMGAEGGFWLGLKRRQS